MKTRCPIDRKAKFDTRMHFGVCQGVSAQESGVSAQGGACPGEVCGKHPPGSEADTPRGQTDTCENIIFAKFICGR